MQSSVFVLFEMQVIEVVVVGKPQRIVRLVFSGMASDWLLDIVAFGFVGFIGPVQLSVGTDVFLAPLVWKSGGFEEVLDGNRHILLERVFSIYGTFLRFAMSNGNLNLKRL